MICGGLRVNTRLSTEPLCLTVDFESVYIVVKPISLPKKFKNCMSTIAKVNNKITAIFVAQD